MPISLSSSDSSTLEPAVQNRFIFTFTSIPGNTTQEDSLAFACKSAGVPNITFNTLEQYRLNERFRFAGRPSFNEIPLVFYDYINGGSSAGEILYNWASTMYNPITGQMTYKRQYATSATLAQLDPLGNVFRLWNIFYAWPSTVTYGETLSSDSDAPTEVTATIIYDYAIKATDATVLTF